MEKPDADPENPEEAQPLLNEENKEVDSQQVPRQRSVKYFGPHPHGTPPQSNRSVEDKHYGHHMHIRTPRAVPDAMTYDARVLITWDALLQTHQNVIWTSRRLWWVMTGLFAVVAIVALIVLALVKDPGRLKPGKFRQISIFLSFFVALLLGFFLSSSMNRWFECTKGYLMLFDTIRNIQMQLQALGTDERWINLLLRYGVVSCHLLSLDLHAEIMPQSEKDEFLEKAWNQLASETPDADPSIRGRWRCITSEEREVLEGVDDPSLMIWIWVGSIVGRMAQDGDVPPMQSPTYGRIMALAENAHVGIRQVRSAVSVRSPFVYVHSLACLVHLNNIVNAISFGLTCGVSIGTCLVKHKIGTYDEKIHVTGGERDRDVQDIIVSFFLSVMGPFIYQALLEVAVAIAQPFGNAQGKIPTERLIQLLENDLNDGANVARRTPGWKPPNYREAAGKK